MDRDMRDISICWYSSGYHAHMAGPCFDKYEDAIKYRDYLERHGYDAASWAFGGEHRPNKFHYESDDCVQWGLNENNT